MALVSDQKFSTFDNGGDLVVGDIIVGLRNGLNTRFSYTGALPPGVIVPIANGGTGANNIVDARINLGLGTMAVQDANAIAITGGAISGVAITNSTAALLSGSVIAAPIASSDLVNKAYVDSFGSPSALTKVDDINITLTLGGIPSTALLQDVSLTLGWTGTLAIVRGGTGVGSVTTVPTATAWAGWDVNSNLSASSLIGGFATTVSAAGTTILTVASKQIQECTGSTTQTYQLPVTATLVAGQSFYIINNSSGSVTVNSSGGNTILVMAANTTANFVCVLNSGTTAASWNASYLFDNGAGVLSITGTANQVIASASTGAVVLSLPQSIATNSAVTFGSLAFSSTSELIGTTTNNNAAAGSVGEIISGEIIYANRTSITTATATNLFTINLTAGDWDLWGLAGVVATGAISTIYTGFSTVSATLPDNTYTNLYACAASITNTLAPPIRVSIASNTTYYLVMTSTFAGTANKFGYYIARRRR